MGRSFILFGEDFWKTILSDSMDRGTIIRNTLSCTNQEDKNLISKCLHKSEESIEEEDLECLQSLTIAFKEIQSANDEDVWLTSEAKNLIKASQKFSHEVGKKYINAHNGLHTESVLFSSLRNYIKSTNSHVATLGYDDVLYDFFIKNHIMSGFNGNLVDGFTNSGFNEENLERAYDNTFGYYFHLYGSPLYYTNKEGDVYKAKRSEYEYCKGDHVILCPIHQKHQIIAASKVLRTYWEKIDWCLNCDDVNMVYFIGYRGGDDILNSKFKNWLAIDNTNREVIIVEPDNSEDRISSWKKKIGDKIIHKPVDSILDFDFNNPTGIKTAS
jgi:hypothetical protein